MTDVNDKSKENRPDVTVVGAGLVGSLLSIFLSRRGFSVEMFERRPDMRKHTISAGRSINLAISTRGINALQRLGLDKEILQHAIPMKGRMIHSVDGDLTFQPYGTEESDYINSISRGTLNKVLMTQAEKDGVRIEFDQRVVDLNIEDNRVAVEEHGTGRSWQYRPQIVIGTDGSASAIRHAMQKLPGYFATDDELNYGYKELVISPTSDGKFKLEKNALHIWPRGNFMLIALPNFEGSFTCTLFLPFKGDVSFEKLTDKAAVSAFFNEYFRDAVPLIDDLEETFFANPTGHMVTVKCNKWNVGGKVLLVGDAAHGIVPFFGQGMNCGFEDCTLIDQLLEKQIAASGAVNWETLFENVSASRVPNTNAIADMAVENFVEMRDKVGDKHFLLEKAIEKVLQKRFPGKYISRYALVTFSNVPYKLAMDAGVIEEGILKELSAGITDAAQVDLTRAEQLIDERLAPLLLPVAKELVSSGAH